jgi:hypothetical protein
MTRDTREMTKEEYLSNLKILFGTDHFQAKEVCNYLGTTTRADDYVGLVLKLSRELAELLLEEEGK